MMSKSNPEIAELFERMADLLEIDDANPFRVRAYRNAARVIKGHSRRMSDLVAEEFDLEQLPAIGKDLAEKIRVIINTGRLPQLDKLARRVPYTLSDLVRIPGLGPKRVKTLYRELGIRSAEDLQRAARRGSIRDLPGFGSRTEQSILESLEKHRIGDVRWRLADAEQVAALLIEYLQRHDGVKQVCIAGSFRRRRETVGDLDILVSAKRGAAICDYFIDYDEVEDVNAHGSTRATVYLKSGMQVDLRVVPEVSYGAALHYFTGSKAHNIAIRKLGQGRGLKINEYGVFKGKQRVAGRSEQEVYKSVNLPYIEPELREDRGELDAAKANQLPTLVTRADIRGDLHCHTNATDGQNTIQAMASAARKAGFEYVAITDHTSQVRVAHGLGARGLQQQFNEIDRLNEKTTGFRVLKSAEVDILENGRLDLPEKILEQLDVVLCALHYRFNLSRRKQTERYLRAIDTHHCQILAHPMTRLINERDALDVDIERVLEAAADAGVAIEINAQPARLDLPDIHVKYGKELGVKFVLSTDAHDCDSFNLMRHAVDVARRGWLEKEDILNTLSCTRLLKALRQS